MTKLSSDELNEILRIKISELNERYNAEMQELFDESLADVNDPLEDLKLECFEADMAVWGALPDYLRGTREQVEQDWHTTWNSGSHPRYVEFVEESEEPETRSKPKADPIQIPDEDIINLLTTEGITSEKTALFTGDISQLCLDKLGKTYLQSGGMAQKLNKIFKSGRINKITKKGKLDVDKIPDHWKYKQSSGGPHNLVTSRCYWYVDNINVSRNKLWWMK